MLTSISDVGIRALKSLGNANIAVLADPSMLNFGA